MRIPVKQLEPGKHVKGTTIAELGNRNRPLDMILYSKDAKRFILMANSSRGVMKIDTADFANAESISKRISGKAGVGYDTIDAWSGIVQLDDLDGKYAVVVRKTDDGVHHLESLALP